MSRLLRVHSKRLSETELVGVHSCNARHLVFEKGLSEFYKESVKSFISLLNSMRKRFNISDLTISLGLIFVFAADILQMAFAQLELPPKEVSTKQLPIIPIMQYQIQLNDITEIVESTEP